MKSPLLAAVASLVALSACTHTPEAAKAAAAPTSAAEYYPLSVGASWQYEVVMLGEKRTIDVAITRQADGFFFDSMGAQLTVDAYGVRDQKRYLLRNPVQPGTKWTNVVSVSSVEQYEILSAGQGCDAPSGQYTDCVVVESRNRMEKDRVLINELTFARGVGIVRLSTVLQDGERRIPQSTLALVKLNPQAAPAAP